MRITLTGRRLALAAVLVLGGVAAPLAYATIGNDSAVNRGPNARSPMRVQTVQATQRTAATADNPIQSVLHFSSPGGSSGCVNLGFFPNETFVVTRVAFITLSGTASRATVMPLVKDQNGADASDFFAFDIPLDADSDGDRAFDFLVRYNQFANASNGDIYGVQLCFGANQGSTLDFVWILTGQKTGAPTAARVASFDATSSKGGATLHWTTASETQILGFNIWRYRGAKGVKVNRTLVRAKRSGEPAGASYRYIDYVRDAKRGLTYRLQLVDMKGKRTWYAAFAIASR